jgi:nicotinamide riboside kinase
MLGDHARKRGGGDPVRRHHVSVDPDRRTRDVSGTAARSAVLFCDTDAAATAIWEERYIGVTSAAVAAEARTPHLYLLTDHAGVPFEDNGLRDGEHIREWMTGRFRKSLASSGVPVVELSGPHRVRLATALAAVDELIASGWDFTEPLG